MTRFFENTKKYRTAFCLLLLLVACMAAVPSMAKYTEKDISAGGFDLVISQNKQVGATTPEELEEDINDDGIADIGGGEWAFELWDGVLDNVHTLTINDGTFDGMMNLRDAKFIINGGTINIGFFWCSASNVTINDGTFTDAGVQFYTDSSSFNLVINGGTFAGIPNVTAGTFVIRGGTFESDPTDYVDENCTVIDNGNGTWTVQ